MRKAGKITKKIYSKYSLNNITKRYLLLGIEDKKSTLNFLNIRLFTSIVIFFIILYTIELGYVLGPIVVGLYYYFLPNIILDSKIKKMVASKNLPTLRFRKAGRFCFFSYIYYIGENVF